MKTSLMLIMLILPVFAFSQMQLVPSGTALAKIDTGTTHWQYLKPITVTVPYFIDSSQISWDQFNIIRDWANDHGYDLDPSNTYADYVIPKNWFTAVKFCNARSEYEGLKPVYYTYLTQDTVWVGGKPYMSVGYDSVYRVGDRELTDEYIDTMATGYKLPTSDQWLLAAYTANLNMFGVGYSWTTWTAGANVCWDRFMEENSHAHWLWIAADSTAIYTPIDELQLWNSLRCVRNYVAPDTTDTTTTSVKWNPMPNKLQLHQNYPNPFNPSTTISYDLPKAGMVNLNVYDIQGRHITTLVNTVQSAGNHTITWNASHLSSGVYFCRINFQNVTLSRKTFLLK